MPSPHAGFATVTVVSESLVNQCLSVYLNTFLTGFRTDFQRTAPVVVEGRSLNLSVSFSAALLSVRANLFPNAAALIHLKFRFYAEPLVDASPVGGGPSVASFNPEIAVDVEVDVALIATVQADHFQFGVDMPNCRLGSIKAFMLDGDGMPPVYQSELVKAIQSAQARAVLEAALKSIDPAKLRATPGTVPAFYDFTMKKPLQPAETWVSARIATSRLLVFPMAGALVVACDVPGFTNGVPTDLHSFLPPNMDIAAATNLDFMQAFFGQNVLPQMHNAFVQNNFRIDSIKFLNFVHKDFDNGPADFMELGLDCSFFTHDFLHFIISGNTKIKGIGVTIPAVPFIYRDEVHVKVGMIEADLPDFLDIMILAFSMILPPLTLFLPAIIASELHNALVDVSSKLNGGPAPSGLNLRQDFALPGTPGPTFRFQPDDLFLKCGADDRFGQMSATLRVIDTPQLAVTLADQKVTVNPSIDGQEIRREGGLSESLKARLILPPAFIHRKDPTLRVRFETALNGKVVPAFTRDMRLFGSALAQIGIGTVKPDQLDIETAKMVSPTKLDQEVRISCRLYRSLGGITEDIYNATVTIVSVDPRPDDVKPFVQWARKTAYWNNHHKVFASRRSKIHKAPGKGGCRFSNQYLTPRFHDPAVFISLRRFTGLPFEMRDIEANRDLVCPYCFFGGPDKHPDGPFSNPVDLTGVVGKIFKP
jgi:hypothetical protein